MDKEKKQRRFWACLLVVPLILLIPTSFLLFSSYSDLHHTEMEANRSREAQETLHKLSLLLLESQNQLLPHTGIARENSTHVRKDFPKEIQDQLHLLKKNIGNTQDSRNSLQLLENLSANLSRHLEQLPQKPSPFTRQQQEERIRESQKLFQTALIVINDLIETEQLLAREAYSRGKSHLNFNRNLTISLMLLDTVSLIAIAYMLRKLQTLSRMVTVCAWSKTIQHEGRWMTFESYLQKQFGISVTHGMSESVYEKFINDTEGKRKH